MRSTIAAVLIFTSLQSLDCLTEISNSRLNYFDIDLLRYVAEGKSGNVMVSPASIKSTLAMLLEGAKGPTATEIQTALRLIPNKDDYRQQLNAFMKGLQVNTSGVSVENANGLFASKKLQFKKEYEMMAKRLYFSEVNKVDFNDPVAAADIINSWVSSKTKGFIPSIVDPVHITPNSELLVMNALYFKGTWLHEFEPKLTHADCFYKNGVCKNVAMMELDAELNYAFVENLRAHALELPYQGNRYSMILIVPQDRDSEVSLIRDLPYIGLLHISKLLQPADVILTMPKFTVEYGENMVAALKNMGIDTLFTTAANLSGIFEGSGDEGHLNSIYHKVYMQVDEKGTVAAAASAGMVVPLIASYVNLRIDKPFLFFIWDNEKGVVLFEGKIEEPTVFVEAQKKLGNDGQEIVKPQPNPAPTLGSAPGKFSQVVPIQQIYPFTSVNQPVNNQPIQPIVSQPVNSQPIQSIVSDRFNNQPIQPTYQPIQPITQPKPTPCITEAPTTSPPTTTQPWYKIIFG